MKWQKVINGEVVHFSLENGFCSWNIFSRKDKRSTKNIFYRDTYNIGEYRKAETKDKLEIEENLKDNILKAIKENFHDK